MRYLLTLFSYVFFPFILNAQTPELVIQSGHTAWINDYTISPDSKYMATASLDNTVKLWDLSSKKEIRTFIGHKDAVTQVVFSHDNKLLASGDDKGLIYLWDVNTGSVVDTFNNMRSITSISFSEDDSRLASFGSSRFFDVIELKTRKRLTTTCLWTQGVKLKFMPNDKNTVAFIGRDSSFYLWDIKGDSCQFYIDYSGGPVTDFVLANKGRYVVSAIDANPGIRIFDLKRKIGVKKIYVWNHIPGHLVNGQNDSTIYTSSNFSDKNSFFIQLKKWNIQTGRCVDSVIVNVHSQYNPKLAFSTATRELVFLYRASGLATATTNPLANSSVLKSSGTLINVIIEKYPGDFLLMAEDGPIKELSTTENKYQIIKHSDGKGFISDATVLQEKPYAIGLLKSLNKLVKINLQTFESKPIIGDSATIREFQLSPNQDRVIYYATTSKNSLFENNSSLVLKDLHNGSALFRKDFETYLLRTYGLLQNGDFVVYQEKLDTITLVSISKKEEIYLADTYFTNVSVSLFKPIGEQQLLSATTDGKIFLWDWKNKKLLKSFPAHEGAWVFDIKFSADSSQFITLADETVKLWDAKTFQLKQSFKGHQSWVAHGGFSLNGKEIYTTGADNTFRTWDVATGKEKASFIMADTADLVTRLPNGYYAATKQGTKHLSYRIGNELFPFEEFDLQFNRPHVVLKALGSKDSLLINAYEKAYYRRLRKSGFNENDFSADIHLPEIDLLNKDKLPVVTQQPQLEITLKATDSKYLLDRYYVSVNNIPLNGVNGTSLKKSSIQSCKVNVQVTLSTGLNRVDVSCMNAKGVESLRKSIYITYQPAHKANPRIYFVGIGVSKYKDKKHNLTYADKDTRDLAGLFKNKYPNASIDTLLNESAIASRIMAIREKLKKTNVDDIVIISVSSHGLLDKNLDYYIGTHDVNFENPSVNGLKYEDLEHLLEDIPARKKLLLIDACHSGEVDKEGGLTEIIKTSGSTVDSSYLVNARGVIVNNKQQSRYKNSLEIMNELFTDVSRTSGAVVISAAGGREYALENAQWNNGVFTFCIKKGLVDGLADTNGDGVSVNELRKYVSEQVYHLTNGLQQPTTRKENVEFDWKLW